MYIFGDYAFYYNLLYQDKDYPGETNFILSVFKKNELVPDTLLDLGCGTGRHLLEVARKGIAVEGVDISETMLSMAHIEFSQKSDAAKLPKLHKGDVRTVRLGRQFDAVTSLFHVMSYQNTEEDALAQLKTAWAHLKPNGLFLFDFWYGPGVLNLKPEFRIKTMEDDVVYIQRTATPTIKSSQHLVTIHYDIALWNKNTGKNSTFAEDHCMRYWFLPELHSLAAQAGFLPLMEGAWLKFDTPTDSDWGAWLLLKKEEKTA